MMNFRNFLESISGASYINDRYIVKHDQINEWNEILDYVYRTHLLIKNDIEISSMRFIIINYEFMKSATEQKALAMALYNYSEVKTKVDIQNIKAGSSGKLTYTTEGGERFRYWDFNTKQEINFSYDMPNLLKTLNDLFVLPGNIYAKKTAANKSFCEYVNHVSGFYKLFEDYYDGMEHYFEEKNGIPRTKNSIFSNYDIFGAFRKISKEKFISDFCRFVDKVNSDDVIVGENIEILYVAELLYNELSVGDL